MLKLFTFNHYQVNCYLIVDVPTLRCAIVDPAAATPSEMEQLTQYVEVNELTPVKVLLTHAHVDHIAGLRQVCERYHLPVSLHREGRILLNQVEAYAPLMGFDVNNMGDMATEDIADGEVLTVGDIEVECRYVPGHCPGSMCFVVPQEKAVLTGDALFHFSIGRTDLPGGDYPTLIAKLKERILTLPEDYIVFPGHGIKSQIGKERKYNPFLCE